MARFFAPAPLVLILCLSLYAGTSDAVTQTNLSIPTTSPNTPADTTTDPSPTHTPPQVTKSETGNTSDLKETWNYTPISPTLTTSQQQNTSTTAGRITDYNQKNTSSLLPHTTLQQQNITKVLTTHTASQQQITSTTAGPSPSRTPTQTPTAPGQATQPSARNDTTSPPNTTIIPLTSTQPTSTLHTFTSITGTTKGPCQYSLMKSVKETVAHVVNINGSEDQMYTITIKDKHNEIRAEKISNRTAFQIPFEWLKPCTEYTVSVDDCKPSGSSTFTSSKNEETVPNTVVTSVTDNEVCLKGIFNDTQKWNLTECVAITEQNSCTSIHTVVLDKCNYTMTVALPPVKPEIRFNTTIPTQFEWTNKPARCNDTFKVICNGKDYHLNTAVLLSLNEQYTCTGEYPYEKPIKSHEHSFQISCDRQKHGQFQHRSSTSLEISWNSLEGDQCSGIEWDSYSVSCNIRDSGGNSHTVECAKLSATSTNCIITNLVPYKNYTCNINGKVNKKDYVIYTGENATLSDKPIFKPKIEVHHPAHNSLEIKCEKMDSDLVWNGGKGTFRAEITYNGETIRADPHKKCLFKFSDLYYLATYNVKITANNTEGHSAFITSEATTKYNDKAVVGFLVFLIVVTSIALLFVLFKIYFRKRKRNGEDEDCVAQDISTSCEYVNVPMRVHRMETTQQTRG